MPLSALRCKQSSVCHYVFMPQCTERAMKFVAADPPGVERQAVHARVSTQAITFFGRTLAPEPSAR